MTRRYLSRFLGRLWLALVVTLAVIAVDHVAKLGAATADLPDYMHNPSPFIFDWLMLWPLAVLFVPSRAWAVLVAFWLGGSASNVIDVSLWPGGVPDFIPVGDEIWNPADFAIYGGAIGAALGVVVWPLWALFRIARRQHPPRPDEGAGFEVALTGQAGSSAHPT